MASDFANIGSDIAYVTVNIASLTPQGRIASTAAKIAIGTGLIADLLYLKDYADRNNILILPMGQTENTDEDNGSIIDKLFFGKAYANDLTQDIGGIDSNDNDNGDDDHVNDDDNDDDDDDEHKHIPPWWPFKPRDSEHVDPVVLNLKKDGGSRALEASFANFDYDGDGFAEQTAWIGKNQGLLVIDRAMAGNTDDKTSRGSYIDARQLNVIEKFFGTKFNDGKNPNKWNGPLLADLYGNIKRYYEGWLSAQTTAAEYTSKISLALDDETGKLNLMETLHLTAPQAMDALKIPPTEQGRVSYTFCHK